ncbi:MAG: DUF5107 domain-containing protein [Kiritimatiellia bacterium]
MATAKILFAAGAISCARLLCAASSARVVPLDLPTYPFSDPDPVPCTSAKRYPYFRYDGFSTVAKTQTWTAVVLENGKVRVTMLPEIGGKVWGALDKRSQREFIYFNHVVKFRDVAMRGPWCSGGIEFNFGIMGHSPTTATPVDWLVRENPDGSASCFVSATEYITRTTWQVEVSLPPDADSFTTKTTWFNASNLPQPYYQWMTAAYAARGNPELHFPGTAYIGHDGDAHAWPVDGKGRNLGVYGNNAFGGSKSYHVLNGNPSLFAIWWPAAKFGSYHVGDAKCGRKIWLWALSRQGGIWEDLLTDADGQYVELQSGRAFNQPRGRTHETPFKHPSFAPGATDVFEETWGALRSLDAIAPACAASNFVSRPLRLPDDFDWNTAYGRHVRGEQALREREERTARQALREALEKEPCLVPALTALAELEMRHGRPARVRELCAKALAVDTYDPAANYLDGFAAFVQGNRPVARERLTLAAYSPLYRAPAQVLLGKLALREGDWRRADDAAVRATQANSFNYDAWMIRLVCARKTGNLRSVRKMLQLATSLVPLNQGIRFEARLAGELDDEAFGRLVLNELPEQMYQELGGWYEEAGLYDEALDLFGRASGLMAKIRLAHAAHLKGDGARAAAALKAAAEMPVAGAFPFRREARPALDWAMSAHASWKFRYLKAVLLAAFGEDSESDRLLADTCDVADEPEVFLYRARRRTGDGRLADLNRAKELGDSWRVGRDLMACLLARGDYAAAHKTGLDCLKRNPGNDKIEMGLARALCGLGRFDEAAAYLETIRVLPSEHGENAHGIWQEAWAGVARLALQKGDLKRADRALERRNEYPENLGLGKPYPPEE